MSFRQWAERPRRLLGLFVIVMVTIAAVLGLLGWHLLDQDRIVNQQQVKERLAGAADLASATLGRMLSDADNLLTTVPVVEPKGDDALTVVFNADGVKAHPSSRLVYYPFVPQAHGAESGAFDDGEAAEFQERNAAKAAAMFRELAGSTNPAIRAGALLRLARTLKPSGDVSGAQAAYDAMTQIGDVPVYGLPADLTGRGEKLSIVCETGQTAICESESRELYTDLLNGRWRLESGPWKFYVAEARQYFRPSADLEMRERDASALAAGVEVLWQEWQQTQNGGGHSSGRSSFRMDDHPVVVLWRSTPEGFAGFVAGHHFIERNWLSALRDIEERYMAHLTLTDSEGLNILGTESASALQPIRNVADAQLQWTLRTQSADPAADLARLASRRHFLLAGLALAALLIFTGGYFITRALTRELEVGRLQSDFVAAVSHEFRTPLASIRQASELLADGRVSSEQRRQEYYEGLRAESERLQRLVENLLNFGRMEAGAEEYYFEPLDPGALVKTIAKEFGAKVFEKGYRLETDTDHLLPHVRGDREALGLAVWNLLDNAVKYSPNSKSVWIETGQEDNDVAIRVRDKGVGIAAADQEKVFRKFVRLGTAKTEGIKGTGLGLAMVERIVCAHGGRIRVASQPGAGSTFTILLPVANGSKVSA